MSGLAGCVVAAFADAHITIDDIFGQRDQVVVRVVVSGTQEGAISIRARSFAAELVAFWFEPPARTATQITRIR